MTVSGSVLLYHNGNKKVLERFVDEFRFHNFRGNWTDHLDRPEDNCLYEICVADSTDYNLKTARDSGIRIFRYISDYQSDCQHQLAELPIGAYKDWLVNVVVKNLCFADVIKTEANVLILDSLPTDHLIIMTTGRTANTHFQKSHPDMKMIESSKTLDSTFLSAKNALLLWRLDQWQCLSSCWVMNNTHPIHQFDGLITKTPRPTDSLSRQWIESDWKNMCQSVLDLSLFFHYVIGRHIMHLTTEDVIRRFRSSSQKIDYDKSQLIPNYKEMEEYYKNSQVEKLLGMCYHNTLNHLA